MTKIPAVQSENIENSYDENVETRSARSRMPKIRSVHHYEGQQIQASANNHEDQRIVRDDQCLRFHETFFVPTVNTRMQGIDRVRTLTMRCVDVNSSRWKRKLSFAFLSEERTCKFVTDDKE